MSVTASWFLQQQSFQHFFEPLSIISNFSMQLSSINIVLFAVAGNCANEILRLVKTVSLPPIYRKDAQRVNLTCGPLRIVAANEVSLKDIQREHRFDEMADKPTGPDSNGQGAIATFSKGPCVDCTILSCCQL